MTINAYTRAAHPHTDWAAFASALETLQPLGFFDSTWKNDTCASIRFICADEAEVTLWIEAADPQMREYGPSDAFAVTFASEDGEVRADRSHETLRDALDQAVLLVAAQNADLDEACRIVQTYIGQDDGGIAGMFFCGDAEEHWVGTDSWADRYMILVEYLSVERHVRRLTR